MRFYRNHYHTVFLANRPALSDVATLASRRSKPTTQPRRHSPALPFRYGVWHPRRWLPWDFHAS